MPANRLPKSEKAKPTERVAGILGVGLDGDDGQHRITRTPEMVVVGGSADTHERMQDTAIYFSEALEKRGKTLATATVPEVADLLAKARDRAG
jgi:hypothetical protein